MYHCISIHVCALGYVSSCMCICWWVYCTPMCVNQCVSVCVCVWRPAFLSLSRRAAWVLTRLLISVLQNVHLMSVSFTAEKHTHTHARTHTFAYTYEQEYRQMDNSIQICYTHGATHLANISPLWKGECSVRDGVCLSVCVCVRCIFVLCSGKRTSRKDVA